jgi:hypothetical protein
VLTTTFITKRRKKKKKKKKEKKKQHSLRTVIEHFFRNSDLIYIGVANIFSAHNLPKQLKRGVDRWKT